MSSRKQRYIREMRQAIIDDIIARHGHYDPHILIEEAKESSHPAHGWFQWDVDKAAKQHWLVQARDFIQGLKVVAFVRTTIKEPPSKIVVAPRYVSDPGTRRGHGGYTETILTMADPAAGRRLLLDAKVQLESLRRRYSGLALFAKGRALLEDWEDLIRSADTYAGELGAEIEEKPGARPGGEASAPPPA